MFVEEEEEQTMFKASARYKTNIVQEWTLMQNTCFPILEHIYSISINTTALEWLEERDVNLLK